MKIAVSYLSVSYNELENCFKKLNSTDVDFIHVDVMDGEFVSNKTLPASEIIPLLELSNKKKDVHLMVNDVISYVDSYCVINPEYITFHVETEVDIVKTIDYIKSKGIKVGLSLNPDTPVNEIIPYLKDIDLVLVMSVVPGMGGQSFIEKSIDRIKELKQIREYNNFTYFIEVDGGIKDSNIALANADISVSGSFITNEENYQEQINKLKAAK